MKMVMSRLVDANVLRYDAVLNVKWHSRIMDNKFYTKVNFVK